MGWFDDLPASASAGSDILNVDLRSQKKNPWCWAACGEMVMDFLGVDVTQCDQANRRFNLTTCCQPSTPKACVRTGWPEFDEYGFTFVRTTYAELLWEQIVDQISNERAPFCFTKKWTGNGGHMLVVFGYSEVDGERFLWVHDPLPVNMGTTDVISYDQYVKGANYTHWHDYYHIRLDASGRPVAGGVGSMRETLPGQQDAIAASRQEALDSLPALSKLLTIANPGQPPGPMSLGKPVTVSNIQLDDLQRVDPPAPGSTAGPALDLLRTRPDTVVYPVLDQNSRVKAEIAIARQGTTWSRARMGSPTLVSRVERVIRIPGALPADAIPAVLFVPALNYDFVIAGDPPKTAYVPLMDDPYGGFSTQQRLTGVELLTLLIAAAKAHDGLPR